MAVEMPRGGAEGHHRGNSVSLTADSERYVAGMSVADGITWLSIYRHGGAHVREQITGRPFIDTADHGNEGPPGSNDAPPYPDDGLDPGSNECLRCYLMRMLDLSGCDGTHRWTERWRDARAPRASGLIRKLAHRGGICCDCEVIFNVWPDYPETEVRLPCAGTAPGCTDPCDLAPTTP